MKALKGHYLLLFGRLSSLNLILPSCKYSSVYFRVEYKLDDDKWKLDNCRFEPDNAKFKLDNAKSELTNDMFELGYVGFETRQC